MKSISSIIFLLLVSCCSTTTVPEKTSCDPKRRSDCDPVPIPTQSITIPTVVIVDTSGPCPSDMVHVEGEFCSDLEEICLSWLDKPTCGKIDPKTKECLQMNLPMRCGEFKFPTVCKSKTKHMNFCIDRYEYPNQLGVKPKLQNTWYQAKAQCEAQSKRLCVDNEWSQACRGPDNLPYPYGYKRDATACNIDLPWQDPTTHTFEQLDKTVPAGSMPACVSPYGAYDMTGNGDEWCKTSGGTPYQSVLKGGHPHGVRNRCTPRTDGHNEYFTFYDTGFRCCKDL